MTKNILLALLLGALVGGGALLWTDQRQPATAQAPADTLGSLLAEIDANGTRATIEFGQAVPRLGRSLDVGEGGAQFHRIGADIVCFVVPGTTVDQIGCVPYANIMSVIYSERR